MSATTAFNDDINNNPANAPTHSYKQHLKSTRACCSVCTIENRKVNIALQPTVQNTKMQIEGKQYL